MTAVLGIDPGQAGALGLIVDDRLIDVIDMPLLDGVDGREISNILHKWNDDFSITRIVLEQVHSMPLDGHVAAFKFGKNYGIIIGVVASTEIPLEYVTPVKWTGALNVGAKDKSTAAKKAAKESRRRRCSEMWPARADLWKRVKDDGRADAALIAYWGVHRQVVA